MPSPFAIDVPRSVIDDLHTRLERTRWPRGITDSGGFSTADAGKLLVAWRDHFDWYDQQRRLNLYPHFTTEIYGLRTHFIHTRSPRSDAAPLLLLHGWPGSFVEFTGVIDRLRDRFHVVVPSLPGFGFSSAPESPGVSNRTIATILVSLMAQLGYNRFGVHGGDVGAGVGTWIAREHPDRVVGLHLNYIPGSYAPAVLDQPNDDERAFLDRASEWAREAGAYGHLQRTRPLTLAYGLSDSPIALATWIAEKFSEWEDPASRVPVEALLTNITIYWVTNTIASSVRLYLESRATPLAFAPGERLRVLTAVARFPLEAPFPPRSWVERAYDVRRWTEMPRGGHFAALEEPDMLARDISEFFSDRA